MTQDPAQTHRTASRLAQLVGEAMIHAAPITSQVDHEEKWRQTEAWLERLEEHTSSQVGPFLQKILDLSEMPAELRPLLEEAIDPPEQFSAIIEQIFVYGFVANIVGTSIQPFLQGVSNALSTAAVAEGISVPVSPSVIATAAARGLELGAQPTVSMPDWAYGEAAKSGVSKEDIDLQASIVGTPPAPQELFELHRRGKATLDEIKQGLREGDTRDDWIDRLVNLVTAWLTPTDFIRAAVQEQMSMSDAEQWAGATGLDVETPLPINVGSSGIPANMFGLGVAIAGRPPGPQELAQAANRGYIDWQGTGADATTFQQGIAESDVKTKWTETLQKLGQYLPPAEAITTLLEKGAITADQAQAYWVARGVPAELAAAYAYTAEQQHIGQDKLLAIGEVKQGYYAGVFSHDEAVSLLDDLGYRDEVAKEILSLIDFRRELVAINAVVRRVSTLYAAHKLTAANAQNALVKVGLGADQAGAILQRWEALREQPVRLPTDAQIGKAVKYGTLTQDQALDELAALGYQPRDAAIVLSAESEVAVKPLPGPGTTITT